LSNCTTEAALAIELGKIVNDIGFDFYHHFSNFGSCDNAQRTLSNLPKSLNEVHMRKIDLNDIIMQSTHHRLTPMIIIVPTGQSVESSNLYSVLPNVDIGTGAIFPIHSKNSDSSALGFFMHKDRVNTEQTIYASLGAMSLAATYLHDAMSRIMTKSDRIPKVPLTRRELECLQLIADYKSNWVISRIFGTSEHAVVYYVRRLMWKLDAQNRHQAVERAAACGLI
jgi:DNA-binding CsgD family transcriptional regulator